MKRPIVRIKYTEQPTAAREFADTIERLSSMPSNGTGPSAQ